MDTPPDGTEPTHRQRVLGDLGNSAPANWDWGKHDDPQPIHALLMLYAGVPAALEQLYQSHLTRLEQMGIAVVRTLDTTNLVDRKEQFGFRDGIGQPGILGVKPGSPENKIQPGEILLGFANAYNKRPVSPAVAADKGTGLLNFGYGGSYLVFRQVHQEVRQFWQYLFAKTATAGHNEADHLAACIKLAAKMVGRWPSGCPLAMSSEVDIPALGEQDEDNFGYDTDDHFGVKVPIGSHIRRSNPRDSLEPGPGGKGRLSPAESRQVTLLHRMIRRGRPYGPPIHPSMKPADILASSPSTDKEDRGLHFICFNASIARQFEFVQQTWLNNPKFGGLYEDNDPIMGQCQPNQGVAGDSFTAQGSPVGQRYRSLPEFVRVRGGAYFFMPGIEAMKYLAGLPTNLPTPLPEELGESVAPSLPGSGTSSRSNPVSNGCLELAKEYPPPSEDAYAQQLAEILRKKVQEDYPTGTTRRDAHAKHQGCVRAEFIVEPDLPPELRVGVFREPRTYQAWVRFSNQDGVPRLDAQKDIRGMAIKLMGVEGKKLLEDEQSEQTQDFLLISHPVFVSKNVEEFYLLIKAMKGGLFSLGWFFFNPFNLHWRSFCNLMASLQRHANLLEIRYWSTTPYLFGDRAVKYSARPQNATATAIPSNPAADYLKDALRQTLAKGEVRFDFLIQFQTDPVWMPIEDPRILWPEEMSPFQKVATIRILQQEFDSPEQMDFGENISYTPWHSLPDHRPLGGINRARKLVYRIISEFRHHRNQTPRSGPLS